MADSILHNVDPSSSNSHARKTHRILPLFNLTNKTAIVSGAAAGIGLEVASALAEAGANVALLYHSNTGAIMASQIITEQYGVKCQAYQVDIRNLSELEQIVEKVILDFDGRLDIFVANSGSPWLEGSMLDGSIEHYHDMMSTNIDGTFFCARVAGKHWRRQAQDHTTVDGGELLGFKMGSFIATGSIMAHVVGKPQLQAPYNAAKAFIVHLCKSLAFEWAGFARANSVSPGYTATEVMNQVPEQMMEKWKEMTTMKRIGRPEEMKGAYLYLASEASSFTTGTDIVVDGGFC